MTRIRWIVLGVSVFVISFGVLLVAAIGGHLGDSHVDLVGKPAPAFAVKDVATGKTMTTQSLAGKVVLVNFWNSWCIPCRQEQPALATFYARHRNDPDFAMVGIVRDDTNARVKAYVASENIGWTIVSDPSSRAAVAYGTTGQPETYVITPGGIVAGQEFGPATVGDLEKMLAAGRGTG